MEYITNDIIESGIDEEGNLYTSRKSNIYSYKEIHKKDPIINANVYTSDTNLLTDQLIRDLIHSDTRIVILENYINHLIQKGIVNKESYDSYISHPTLCNIDQGEDLKR